MSDTPQTESIKRKSRKKLTYQKILQQMEFYFSPANLAKDRWLSSKLAVEEYVCLTEFLKFNKIRALTEDVNDLAKALRKSDILTVTDDMKVKRIQPIKFKENEDDYVLYVEQVPPDADHDWLKNIFSQYGDIDYISIPRFKNSNKCKGFAFIEFSKVEAAQNATQDFKEKGYYLSTDIAPEELLSIANYEGDVNKSEDGQDSKVQMDDQTPTEEPTNPKKRKNSDLEESDDDPEETQKKTKLEDESGYTLDAPVTEDNLDVEESGKVKKKKNRKKKHKKNKITEGADHYGLQILTKKDWKRVRNKYLNMQKEKMKQLKKHLFLAQKKSDQSKHHQFVMNKKTNDKNQQEKAEEKKGQKEIPPKEYEPGLIVRIKLDEPVVEVKNFKNDIKKNNAIKYVDVKEGDTTVHLRFESAESASEYCKDPTWPDSKVLTGQKESEYWDKLQQQRNEKLSTKATKKGRGKDKLMKKAEHILGKHIIFEEIDAS